MTSLRAAVGCVAFFASLSFSQTIPTINTGGVVRGADNYDASINAVARGSQFAIWGLGLAPSVASAPGVPLPTRLNGVRVKVLAGSTGEWDAPLIYVSPFQINALLPSAVPEGQQSVVVEVNGQDSPAAPIMVTTGSLPLSRAGISASGRHDCSKWIPLARSPSTLSAIPSVPGRPWYSGAPAWGPFLPARMTRTPPAWWIYRPM